MYGAGKKAHSVDGIRPEYFGGKMGTPQEGASGGHPECTHSLSEKRGRGVKYRGRGRSGRGQPCVSR